LHGGAVIDEDDPAFGRLIGNGREGGGRQKRSGEGEGHEGEGEATEEEEEKVLESGALSEAGWGGGEEAEGGEGGALAGGATDQVKDQG
jgi:hypothetical protein